MAIFRKGKGKAKGFIPPLNVAPTGSIVQNANISGSIASAPIVTYSPSGFITGISSSGTVTIPGTLNVSSSELETKRTAELEKRMYKLREKLKIEGVENDPLVLSVNSTSIGILEILEIMTDKIEHLESQIDTQKTVEDFMELHERLSGEEE